jgi:glycyl-tRNA synthetase beta chain
VKFLLELASEEIPARMQAAAAQKLADDFFSYCGPAGLDLYRRDIVADATPRRLWLIASDMPVASGDIVERIKGPRADAPAQAIEGFLKKNGLKREQLEEHDTGKGVALFATVTHKGRPTTEILAEIIPQIVRDFQWPKSMRWGAASVSTASPRWVRPLTGIVALLDGEVVACEAHGVAAGRVTRGHRIHAPEPISIESADSYAAQLLSAKVIVASAERRAVIEAKAAEAASAKGLSVIPDAGLVAENAGLTEWPVPMLGSFDPAFLAVPREVIQLTMRTNQKYFACADTAGALAPAFVCVANLEASDGGVAVVKGNERVLSARLSDAKFFWDQDVATVKASPDGLGVYAPKLEDIVFHAKLGTIADKVERVAALARWLAPATGADPDQCERAARLANADLITATVGEFPEVQGLIGRYLATEAGEVSAVADAIRDHYKPVGQGDDVPTAPVSVAVALADKLDTLVGFFAIDELPSGSRDPFALRRQVIGVAALINNSKLRLSLSAVFGATLLVLIQQILAAMQAESKSVLEAASKLQSWAQVKTTAASVGLGAFVVQQPSVSTKRLSELRQLSEKYSNVEEAVSLILALTRFAIDRFKVQQREAGVRHDLIDAVFALGGEDDLVRLLARVKALQAFVATDDGANLLAGYKRAANILKIELAKGDPGLAGAAVVPAEATLGQALDVALPAASAAVKAEDFAGAMTALAGLRAPVDRFFADVMVNDPDPMVRAGRLALLARFRDAVHEVADFSRIEG